MVQTLKNLKTEVHILLQYVQKDGGNCTGEQTFTVVATAAALNAVSAKTQYTTPYTGDEIKPSKSDLGDLVIQYYNATGVILRQKILEQTDTKSQDIQTT